MHAPPPKPPSLADWLDGRWLQDASVEVGRRLRASRRPRLGAAALWVDPVAVADRLRGHLDRGWWLPRPPHVVQIPKRRGGTRRLSVFHPEEQVVHAALQRYLGAWLDPLFSHASWGFRPRRSVDGAGRRVARLIDTGSRWVADLDVADCFATICHRLLFDRLRGLDVRDEALLTMLDRILRVSGPWSARGLAQGSPLSPLLANVHLHSADLCLDGRAGYLRYADDLVCLARSADEAGEAFDDMRRVITDGGQEAAPAKSGPGAVRPGWRWLGWVVGTDGRLTRPPRSPGVRTAPQARLDGGGAERCGRPR